MRRTAYTADDFYELYIWRGQFVAEFMAVGIGGFIGACLRYLFSRMTSSFLLFPLGTLLSNVIAGFLIGFIIGLEQQSVKISKNAKLFMTTGFLGGLSTFSTFNIETIGLFTDGKYMLSVLNVALNLGLSMCGAALGLFCAKALAAR